MLRSVLSENGYCYQTMPQPSLQDPAKGVVCQFKPFHVPIKETNIQRRVLVIPQWIGSNSGHQDTCFPSSQRDVARFLKIERTSAHLAIFNN